MTYTQHQNEQAQRLAAIRTTNRQTMQTRQAQRLAALTTRSK